MGENVVEAIDLSPFTGEPSENGEYKKEEILRAWKKAFSTIGFAVITGHGVPLQDVLNIQNDAKDFFRRETEEKMKSCLKSGYGKGGFVPIGMESVASSKDSPGSKNENERPPDLVESLYFLEDGAGNDVVPDMPVTMKESVQKYCKHMQKFLSIVMEISALALGLPKNFFVPAFYRPQNALRLSYYPAQDREKPKPNQIRYGAHTDYTGFTLLRPDDEIGGLEVFVRENSKWAPVEAIENCFIVNAGDLIQRWTNDHWISNLHRVVNPAPELCQKARLSLVYFTGPSNDTEIAPIPECCSTENPPKYAPVIAGEYLASKLKASNTKKI